MRRFLSCLALCAFVGGAACAGREEPAGEAPEASWIPATVECQDEVGLAERAEAARVSSGSIAGDQDRIDAANYANFLASLVTVANIRCRITAADAGGEELIHGVLSAGRHATQSSSFYERTARWAQAHWLASDAIRRLLKGLEISPAPKEFPR